MMMRIMMTLAIIMVMGMMVLLVKRIVVQVHHAGEGGGETHPVGDRAVSVQPHHLVLLGHVVQKTETQNQSNLRSPGLQANVTFSCHWQKMYQAPRFFPQNLQKGLRLYSPQRRRLVFHLSNIDSNTL